VKKGYGKAAELYRRAAEKGENPAKYHLARMYRDGLGMQRDLDKAEYWYRAAATNGYEPAREALKAMAYKSRKAGD
jgi:TPR repeat protein